MLVIRALLFPYFTIFAVMLTARTGNVLHLAILAPFAIGTDVWTFVQYRKLLKIAGAKNLTVVASAAYRPEAKLFYGQYVFVLFAVLALLIGLFALDAQVSLFLRPIFDFFGYVFLGATAEQPFVSMEADAVVNVANFKGAGLLAIGILSVALPILQRDTLTSGTVLGRWKRGGQWKILSEIALIYLLTWLYIFSWELSRGGTPLLDIYGNSADDLLLITGCLLFLLMTVKAVTYDGYMQLELLQKSQCT